MLGTKRSLPRCLHFFECFENFGGVAFGAHGGPHSRDEAVWIDQIRTADNPEKRFAEEHLHAARTVGFNGFKFRIAQQRKRDVLFGGKLGHRFGRVGAARQNLRVQLLKLLVGVTKLGRFADSTAGVGLHEEKQQHIFAAVLGQRDGPAVLRQQLEVGSFLPFPGDFLFISCVLNNLRLIP